MENTKYCQSCAMPLTTKEAHGTEKDGSLSEDYCSYCYTEGAFNATISMEEMMALCAPAMAEANPDITEAEAMEQMRQFFPGLRRWQQ